MNNLNFTIRLKEIMTKNKVYKQACKALKKKQKKKRFL